MSGISIHNRRRLIIGRQRQSKPLWKRVGKYLRARREELGLSQQDVSSLLGYASRNAVSNVEVGIEGVPAKRIYAWADVLDLPRGALYRFATGETSRMDCVLETTPRQREELTSGQKELIDLYRALPVRYQRRLREHAKEFQALCRSG